MEDSLDDESVITGEVDMLLDEYTLRRINENTLKNMLVPAGTYSHPLVKLTREYRAQGLVFEDPIYPNVEQIHIDARPAVDLSTKTLNSIVSRHSEFARVSYDSAKKHQGKAKRQLLESAMYGIASGVSVGLLSYLLMHQPNQAEINSERVSAKAGCQTQVINDLEKEFTTKATPSTLEKAGIDFSTTSHEFNAKVTQCQDMAATQYASRTLEQKISDNWSLGGLDLMLGGISLLCYSQRKRHVSIMNTGFALAEAYRENVYTASEALEKAPSPNGT